MDVIGDGPDRIKIKNIAKNAELGKITFDVFGVSATPQGKPTGDTTIRARIGGEVVGQTQAIVVIPYTHTRTYSAVEYKNTATLMDDETQIETTAEVIVTLLIVDQFGDGLDKIYDGNKVVTEVFTAPVTGVFDELFDMDDRDVPLAIEFPEAKLSAGVKRDAYKIGRRSKVGVLTAEQRDQWSKFTLTLKPDGKEAAWNNAFAFRLEAGVPDPATSIIWQTIQVHAHDVVYRLGETDYLGVVRKFTQEKKQLTVPLGGTDTPVTLTESQIE